MQSNESSIPTPSSGLKDLYEPSEALLKSLKPKSSAKNVQAEYSRAHEDFVKYWDEKAQELVWTKKWTKTLDDSSKPFYKWFVGGETNICMNALDRHLITAKRNQVALLWENELGQTKTYTYQSLHDEVARFASVLHHLNVKKGDIVTLYMPLVPELPIAMLACARIGAVHSVIYGGFSIEALTSRIEDAKSKILITADGGYRRGKIVELKHVANEAMLRAPTIETCIMVRHTGHLDHASAGMMVQGRDYVYEDLMKSPMARELKPSVPVDAEHSLFVLYTSGTTGKPKGLVHTHGGYGVYTSVTHQYAFDIQDSDRFWCTADPGWITGHSYVVYGPLINGSTIFMYEGAPNYPSPDRWWQMIEKHKISTFYTSPTAIRGLMRFGDQWPKRHDLSSLRILGSVGEPINPEAWRWFHTHIGASKCPIIDTWWQTETGGFVITPLPSTPLKPGSCTKPFFGHEVAVVDENGKEAETGHEGFLVLKRPWPGMARTILGDPDRFVETYFKQYEKQGWYRTGDSARIDKDGYTWVIGRVDDVIKVSGYRLGTAEVESALVSHPSVAEAAVIGLPHELKGHAIHAFVMLRVSGAASIGIGGGSGNSKLIDELKEHVVKEIGPIARPEQVMVLDALPKTRSGKIMRRVLKARALGQDVGDISTLEE